MKKTVISIIILLSIVNIFALNCKQRAIKMFQEGQYNDAYETMKHFNDEHEGDAEALFYLGRFLHFIQYDTGKRVYNEIVSDSIIDYLDRSIAISDTIGNAFYYMGVEYGVRGHYAFIAGDTVKTIKEFTLGYEKGGYPQWLLEYGNNIFLSCDSNAILFTGGDAEANSLWYLQTVKGIRRDVTVLPLGLLSYAPFVKFIKNGIHGFFRSVPITMSDSVIDSFMYRYFEGDSAALQVSSAMKKQYALDDDYIMKWALKPDYVFSGKEIITPGTGIVLQMLEHNAWKRPAYFTIASMPELRASLDDYLCIEGMCYRIMPIIMKDKPMNTAFTASLLMDTQHLKYYPQIRDYDMPRCSMVMSIYAALLVDVHAYYVKQGMPDSAEITADYIKKYLDIGVLELPYSVREAIDRM